MKNCFLALVALAMVSFPSLKAQTDIAKEEAAIKAVFEGEKAAFFRQDYVGMGEFWVHDPSTMKYWLTSKGSNKIIGWDNVNESQKKETEDNSWDRKKFTATFSNYRINITGDAAWVFCETTWDSINDKGEKIIFSRQERIVVLKKTDGKWKFSLYSIFQMPDQSTAK